MLNYLLLATCHRSVLFHQLVELRSDPALFGFEPLRKLVNEPVLPDVQKVIYNVQDDDLHFVTGHEL